MGKTTNILDLNNRLTKVEKENVAQNSYTSLKNKPKINGVTLTGNKSLADIGAAAAADLATKGNKLTTNLFSVPGVEVRPSLTTDYTFNVTKSGYTALGVVGFYIGGGTTSSIVSAMLTGEASVTVRIINTGAAALTPININIIVLYVQNDPT